MASEHASAANWIDVWNTGGPFICGILVGCVIMYYAFKTVLSEREKRDKADADERKELKEQIELKQSRIDRLHTDLQAERLKVVELVKKLNEAKQEEKGSKV